MKKTISLLLALIILSSCAVIFSGCSGENSKDYPVTIGDVTIKSEPKNIVVLNDNLADIISYIGYDVKMVGRAITCDQDFLKVVPSVGSAENPAVDTIQSYETDLVIADNTLSEKSRSKLEEAGIPVVTFTSAESFDELETLYVNLGTVLGGNVTGAAKGAGSYQDLFSTLSSFKKAVSGIVKTFAYLYMDQNGQLYTFTGDSMQAKILSYTGALNIFANQEQQAVVTSELKIGTPTYIFYDSEEVLDYLRNDESLSTLSALTSGRTFRIPLKSFSRQGTTLMDNVYQMTNIMFVQSETEAATPDEIRPSETPTLLAPAAETEAEEDEEDEEENSDEFTYDEYGNIVY